SRRGPRTRMNPSPQRTSRASLFRLGRLVRKELVEIIRDRRTIITLVLMPLLLYPLLSVAFQQFFLASSMDPSRASVYRLGFATEHEARVFGQFLSFGEKLAQRPKVEPKTPAGPSQPGPQVMAMI